jgi:CubicO group peptidase (beta-lactamase class C family)
VQRGELRLSDRVSDHLPLSGTAGGDVSVQQLVTHQAGYPRLGRKTLRRGQLAALTGANPYTADLGELLGEVREAGLGSRGTYEYSNLGAAVAGQAAAAASGLSYRDLMRSRVFEPLRMSHTEVADRVTVAGGSMASGARSAPWVMDAYAPAGGVVTTSEDLATFATAVLDGRAPGRAAMKPLAGTDQEGTSIGMFWHITERPQRQGRIVWHNGRTGGYSSFMGFDLDAGRAVVVLANVATSVDELGVRLLTETG